MKGAEVLEDEAIINLFWNRDETAISQTAKKYSKYCRTISYNILSNMADVEECENDTYLAVWNTIPPTKPNNFHVFIGRITRNIAFNKFDYNKAQKRNNEFDHILSELEECIASSDNTEDRFTKKETASLISDFIRSMEIESANIFIRRYWHCDSIKDISKRFSISESKIKSSLFRARNNLKLFLEKEGIKI